VHVSAVFVIAAVSAAVTVGGTIWLFVWAARKDGEDQERRDQEERRTFGSPPP
jgi:hypothetical protein